VFIVSYLSFTKTLLKPSDIEETSRYTQTYAQTHKRTQRKKQTNTNARAGIHIQVKYYSKRIEFDSASKG
jgi:hypothetical protein